MSLIPIGQNMALHPDAPKANKPEAICDLHEKILQNYLNQLGFLS